MKRILLCCICSIFICKINAQLIFIKNDKYGLKDSAGHLIVKAKYDNIEKFNEGIAIFKLKDKFGIINSEGKEIMEATYQAIQPRFFASTHLNAKLAGKWGLLNLDGEVVVAPKYADPIDMFYLSENTIVSLSKSIIVATGEVNKMYGVIDNISFKEIVSLVYTYLKDAGFGYFKVSKDDKNKKYGIIDANEKIIFDLKYDYIYVVSKDIIAYGKNGKYVLVNSKGYSISSEEYETVFQLSENRAKVKHYGKFGYIDEKGKEVIPCMYDEADEFYGEKAKVRLGSLKFEIDTNGDEVTTSKTIRLRSSLIFADKSAEKAFNLINFKENVTNAENIKLVDKYLNTNNTYITLKAAIDNLMSEAANNKIAYKEFANYLYRKFSDYQFACYDAIPIHISQNYMCNTDAPYGGGYWLEAENKKEICDFAMKQIPSLCGEIIKEIPLKLLPQTSSKYLRLSDIKSKYTILFFWNNECVKCEKDIKILASNYAQLKKMGVEIIAVSIDDKAQDKCEQLIVSYKMDWINTVDINKTISIKLNTTNMPYLFLLDENKQIIIKEINAEQVIEYLKR